MKRQTDRNAATDILPNLTRRRKGVSRDRDPAASHQLATNLATKLATNCGTDTQEKSHADQLAKGLEAHRQGFSHYLATSGYAGNLAHGKTHETLDFIGWNASG